MNREQVRALLGTGILQAFSEGKAVQYERTEGEGECGRLEWVDIDFINLALFRCYPERYRIKPEPMHDWVVESAVEEGLFFMVYSRTAGYMKEQYPNHRYRQLVDVLDEE